MSSRAASSRKNLINGDVKKSSGLFFRGRSKSSASRSDAPLKTPPLPPIPNSPRSLIQPGSSPYDSQQDVRSDHSDPERERSRVQHSLKKVTSESVLVRPNIDSVYTSQDYDDYYSSKVRLSARPNASYGVAQQFIEASYQPPPPIHSSYQPPPPNSTQNNVQPLAPLSGNNKASSHSPSVDTIFAFPSPPTYPPSLRSPTRPGPLFVTPPPSVSTRSNSPTLTEPPTYTPLSPYSPIQSRRPSLPVHNTSKDLVHLEYNPRNGFSVPPSPNPSVYSPQSMQNYSFPNSQPNINPSNNGLDRAGYYEQVAGQSSSPASLRSPIHELLNPPQSVTSFESDHSSNSAKQDQKMNSGFVFPGSRSAARPNAISTTAKRVKSRVGIVQEPESFPLKVLNQPPPSWVTQSSFKQSYKQESPCHLTYSAEDVSSPVPQSPRHTKLNPETSSAFSDDSEVTYITGGNESSNSVNLRAPAPAPFYLPGSRSRAQPTSVLNKKNQGRKTSSNGSENPTDEGKTFFGISLKKKKKPVKTPEPSTSSSKVDFVLSTSSESSSRNNIQNSQKSDARSQLSGSTVAVDIEREQKKNHFDYVGNEATIMQMPKRLKSRIGSYPLDPYDSILLDNDRHTGELLARLNPGRSPTFFNYGNTPPSSVLDLGCGQGHWVVDAAIAWKGYGTKVTGYDMVDISKSLQPWAAEQRVTENIRFVRGNFLKQRLPFKDNSFDFIRMSCLALCITSDAWIFVLQEVCRVLMVGGRLELIDDMIFFPYGNTTSDFGPFLDDEQSIATKLDTTIPSSSITTTYSIYDSATANPGLGLPVVHEQLSEELQEVLNDDDTATLNNYQTTSTATTSFSKELQHRRVGLNPKAWQHAYETSQDLEALFEHMLSNKFGINKDPRLFILDLLKQVFGHAHEVKTMHISLAPPNTENDGGQAGGKFKFPSPRRESIGLSLSPGLMLWPSTFIPMNQSEIEIHASKHLRMLLSCKNLLLEHAVEATDGVEIDEGPVLEALWEYEGFLRNRFHPPPMQSNSAENLDVKSSLTEDINLIRNTAESRLSMAESISTNELEDMWEIQSEFQQRFAWHRPGSRSLAEKAQNKSLTTNGPNIYTPVPRTRPGRSGVATPYYSHDELTHVRTFHVYEAIKLDDTTLGNSF